MIPLVSCPSCARHVRVGELDCPFCARPVPAGLVAGKRGPRRQYVGKGATALALASALAATGCGDDGATAKVIEPQGDAQTDAPDTATFALDATGGEPDARDAGDARADSDAADDGGHFPIYK